VGDPYKSLLKAMHGERLHGDKDKPKYLVIKVSTFTNNSQKNMLVQIRSLRPCLIGLLPDVGSGSFEGAVTNAS
jgi:hypothetical protein